MADQSYGRRADSFDDPDAWRTRSHAPGTCATYGICGHRKDRDVLNCANNTAARPLPSEAAHKLVRGSFDCFMAYASAHLCALSRSQTESAV